MNIRQTMLHLSGGLLLLLAPACTSEVDLEGGQPLEVTAEIVSSLRYRRGRAIAISLRTGGAWFVVYS